MALKHIEHIEELLLQKSTSCGAFFVLKKTLEILKTQTEFSVKYDGAPALVCGTLNNKFFISTKSIFNKTPLVAYSISDIDRLFKGAIKPKLKTVFNALKNEKFENIIQFDLMFCDSEIKDKFRVEFCPNVVNYTVLEPKNKLLKYKCGIAVHSVYKSTTLEDLQNEVPAPCVNNYIFKEAYVLPRIGKSYYKGTLIDEVLKDLETYDCLLSSDVIKLYKMFVNDCIKKRKDDLYDEYFVDEFIEFIDARKIKEAQSFKTQAKQKLVLEEYNQVLLELFSTEIKENICKITRLQQKLCTIKCNIIRCLEVKTIQAKIGTFIMHEGIVLFVEGTHIKLVNRYMFSAENFLKNGTTFGTAFGTAEGK